MSIATVITGGYGSFGSIAQVIAGGYLPLSSSGQESESIPPSGGFRNTYDAYMRSALESKRKREKLRKEAEAIEDAKTREIVRLLQKKQAETERQDEIDRLTSLVKQNPDTEEAKKLYGDKAAIALARAALQQNFSAVEALQRELMKAKEEEEFLMMAIQILLKH